MDLRRLGGHHCCSTYASFPRRREPSWHVLHTTTAYWMPACAGMTLLSFSGCWVDTNFNLPISTLTLALGFGLLRRSTSSIPGVVSQSWERGWICQAVSWDLCLEGLGES